MSVVSFKSYRMGLSTLKVSDQTKMFHESPIILPRKPVAREREQLLTQGFQIQVHTAILSHLTLYGILSA